ncbi:hypothetical protein HZS_5225 [Henneguya salminicola]|nr:hypothetical protein HZS_5225 [Henneguya salminicola]
MLRRTFMYTKTRKRSYRFNKKHPKIYFRRIPKITESPFQIYKTLIETFNKNDQKFISYIPSKYQVYIQTREIRKIEKSEEYHIISSEPYCNLIDESPFLQTN